MRGDSLFSFHKLLVFVLRPMMSMPIRIVCWLLPKDNNLWIVGCHGGKVFNGNSYYFHEYLKKERAHKRVVVITHNPKVLKQVDGEVYMAYSAKGLWLVARASHAFITNFVEDDLNIVTISSRLKVVNMWHGIPIKSIRWPRPSWMRVILRIVRFQIPKPTWFLSTYELPLENTPEQFELSESQIAVVGYPRNDHLLNNDKVVPQRLAASKAKQHWLYAPTFRGAGAFENPLSVEGWREVDAFLEQEDILLLVSHHPMTKEFDVIKNLEHVVDIGTEAELVMPWLKQVDFLITDYSSICIDFALTDKPMFFFPYDYEQYEKEVGFCLDYFADLPGPFVATEKEFISILPSMLKRKKKTTYQRKYATFKKKFHKYESGLSSKRLYELVVGDE